MPMDYHQNGSPSNWTSNWVLLGFLCCEHWNRSFKVSWPNWGPLKRLHVLMFWSAIPRAGPGASIRTIHQMSHFFCDAMLSGSFRASSHPHYPGISLFFAARITNQIHRRRIPRACKTLMFHHWGNSQKSSKITNKWGIFQPCCIAKGYPKWNHNSSTRSVLAKGIETQDTSNIHLDSMWALWHWLWCSCLDGFGPVYCL